MYCGKGVPGYLLCKHKGKKGKCQALFLCYHAEPENERKTKEAQFHLW